MIKRMYFTMFILLGLVCTGTPAMASATPPTQSEIVQEMGTRSELLVNALLGKDRQLAGQHYRQLKADLDQLHALSAKMNFSERRTRELFTAYSWMRLIAIDMRAGTWTGAAIAANQMSGEIIRFTDFVSLTLRDIAWMDYLGRDVMLLSMEDMQGNRQNIDLRRNELGETWKRVREDMIKDFRNKTLVIRGDQLIERMQQAGDSKSLIELSRKEHDFVLQIRKALTAKKT